MKTTQSRLAEFVKHTGLSDNQFTIRTGMSNGLLANIIKRGSSCTTDTLEKILKSFPELNIEWILRGEGSMLRSVGYRQQEEQSASMHEPASYYATKPAQHSKVWIVPSTVASFSKKSTLDFSFFSIPWLGKGEYFLFTVQGDAMEPTLTNGDHVVGKEIFEAEEVLNGHAYVIVTQEATLMRRIIWEETETSFRLVSDNDAYGPTELLISKVERLFQIVEKNSRNLGISKEKEMIGVYKQLLKAKGLEF